MLSLFVFYSVLDWSDSSPLNISLIWQIIFNTQSTYISHDFTGIGCIVSEIVSSTVAVCSGYHDGLVMERTRKDFSSLDAIVSQYQNLYAECGNMHLFVM